MRVALNAWQWYQYVIGAVLDFSIDRKTIITDEFLLDKFFNYLRHSHGTWN